MKIVFPDVPEYHFILKGLYSDKFASYPKFKSTPILEFEEDIDSDIVFAPAPIAVLNSRNYVFLRVGNIFSYFSGPLILSGQKEDREYFVRKEDPLSEHYAKILLGDVSISKGDGFPAILEPRLALLGELSELSKFDLYEKWREMTDNVPFPLYLGLMRDTLTDLKGIVEEAVRSSIKYALDNSSSLIKEIASFYGIENIEMLKMAILRFINKNTMDISEEEVDSLRALSKEMRNSGFHVSKVRF